jgi:uncharacterized protein YbaP (TraB family)
MWKWVIGVAFISTAWTQTEQVQNELLWEISGNGLKTKSYLYGSLHSNDKRLFKFADSVYVALNKATLIVLETDIFSLFDQWDTRQATVNILYDNKGNPYTSSNEATKTLYGDEDGMPQFLDAYFLEYCYNAEKKFFPLEKVEDQLELIEHWKTPSLTRRKIKLLEVNQERMIELYLKGDIDALDRIMRTNLAVYPGKYQELIVNRNTNMVKKIDSVIRLNSTFCAVGAGHLSGESGLINALRKKGYRLRCIPTHYSEIISNDKKSVQSKRSYSYTNDTLHLKAVFSGKPLITTIWENHPFIIYREMGQGNTYSIEIAPLEEGTTLAEQAAIYIASPTSSTYKHRVLDDGSEVYEGLSDAYPEGLHWVRLIQNDRYLIIMKTYGGNKFMNSNRPATFFNSVWFE